jgi:hypothetical protein
VRTEVWLALLLVFLALPARAQLRRPSLQWTRGPAAGACIDPLTLAERVEALTGPMFFMPPHDYAIEGHIDALANGFRMRVTVTGADRTQRGERAVEHAGSDCRGFDEAIVFVIALLIDPDLDLERLTGDAKLQGRSPGDALLSELEAHPPRPIVLEPVPRQQPIPQPEPKPPYRWTGAMALAMGRDALPGYALGPLLAAHFPLWRWLQLGVQARMLARATRYDIDGNRELRMQSSSFAALVCGQPPSERLYARLCAGPEPSLVHARGVGFAPGRGAILAEWGALASVEMGYRLDGRWSLVAQGFVRVAFVEKRFVYRSSLLDSDVNVARLTRFGGGATLGVAYRFSSGISAPRDTHLRR